MITHAFTCSGAYSLLIMTGLKRVENRSAFPTPDKGRCAVSVSKKFCQDEYDNLMAWLKGKVADEVYASMPTWNDVKDWPGRIVGTFTREQMTITSIPGPDRSVKMADIKRLHLLSKGDCNRRIGEFLKELDLAEARNTGYPVILGAAKKNGSPRPILETNTHRDYFTFVLPIHEMFLKSDAETVRELNATDPVSDPVDSRVVSLVEALADGPLTAANLRAKLSVSHRKFFRDHYVNPAVRGELIVPEEGMSLHNPRLRYFITDKGRRLLMGRKES